MTNEDRQVSQVNAQWGRVRHRKIEVKRTANGYIVEYDVVNPKVDENDHFASRTLRETRVFITNSDLFDFVRDYFADEPKP